MSKKTQRKNRPPKNQTGNCEDCGEVFIIRSGAHLACYSCLKPVEVNARVNSFRVG